MKKTRWTAVVLLAVGLWACGGGDEISGGAGATAGAGGVGAHGGGGDGATAGTGGGGATGGSASSCDGDGQCAVSETCAACPEDCGPCERYDVDRTGVPRRGTLGALDVPPPAGWAPAFEGQQSFNGYFARYEADIGSVPPCDQTIGPDDPWSTIDDAQRVICLAAGDHTAKGPLELSVSGAEGDRRWLRLAGEDLTHPAHLAEAEQARVASVRIEEMSHWTVHRVTMARASGVLLLLWDCDQCIVDSVLADGLHGGHDLVTVRGSGIAWLQNSVIRHSGLEPHTDHTCFSGKGNDKRIVNNEIYGCGGDAIVLDTNSDPDGTVLENNDLYQSADYWIGCDGNPGDDCSCGEDGIDIKEAGALGAPVIAVRNRVWGWKGNIASCSSSGGPGVAINTGGEERADGYILIQDNIVMTSAYGMMLGKKGRVSVVGNLVFDIHYSRPDDVPVGIVLLGQARKEAYWNTMVDSAYGMRITDGSDHHDVRCNLWVGLAQRYNTAGFNETSDFDNNGCYATDGYYETPGRTPDGPEVDVAVATWSAGAKAVGDLVYADPDNGFVYRLRTGGQADTVQPSWSTECGVSTDSEGNSWEAAMCPYSFERKRWTGPETVVIPYARPSAGADHVDQCVAVGVKPGSGIDDLSREF